MTLDPWDRAADVEIARQDGRVENQRTSQALARAVNGSRLQALLERSNYIDAYLRGWYGR